MKRLHAALSILLVCLVSGAWVIKDTANPVDIYTGSNTTPTIDAATTGVVTVGPTGSTVTHAVNGAVSATRSTDSNNVFTTTGVSTAAQVATQSGNGTTSARFSYFTGQSLETVPQRWDWGLYGTKDWTLRDVTNARSPLAVSASTGGVTFQVGAILPSTGAGTATGISASTTTLDFYETANFASNFLPNAGGTAVSVGSVITRVGKTVTLYFGTFSATCVVGTNTITNVTAIPTRFQPIGPVIIPIAGHVNGGSNTPGGIIQLTGGTINIFRDFAGTAFTAGGCGPIQASVTYITN